MNKAESLQQINDFEAHYRYDSNYMRELLESSPAGFEKFNNFLPMARHREQLANVDYWVARLAAMQAQDCGECLQLTVRMALEAGMDKPLIELILSGGDELPEELKDIYQYAVQVTVNGTPNEQLLDRIQRRYSRGELLEFGLCIASAAVFPMIKRAIGNAKSCRLMEIEI